jgi:hypothetical protein
VHPELGQEPDGRRVPQAPGRGDRFEVYSAGIDPTPEIHPCAVESMVVEVRPELRFALMKVLFGE